MICESCKFDNREGALFCAECGKPLAAANKDADNSELKNEKDVNKTVILDEVVTNSKESVDNDDSEANTTVLTSDMLKPAQAATPQGFTAGPAPMKPMAPQAPASGQPVPMAPQAPASGQPVPMAPQAPKMVAPQPPVNGQPVPMAPQAPKMAAPQPPVNGQSVPMAPQAPKMAAPQPPVNGQPTPANPQMAPSQASQMGMAPTAAAKPATEKPAKADKKGDKKAAKAAKNAEKGKMKTGTKVYIVISIILMLAMAGALVYGYIYHTDKMDTANTEIENLKASNSDAQATISQKENEIANLYASSTDAQTTISSLETQLADSQAAQATAQATADSYIAYDPLISFVESSTADSSTDMMVSDTVVYTTTGSTVQVFVYFPSQEGQLSYTVSDVNVVDCTWGEEWVNGNVLPISIDAKAAGDVTIEVTNDQNDIKETIFVHVE